MANTKVPSEFLEDNLVVAGDLTVDTSTLVVDSTNNRVGVGTSSPARSLHIRSTGEGSSLFLERTSNYGFVLYNEVETTTETFHLGFVNNGTFSSDILVANESGNVGIGTSSPASVLDVRGITNIRADGGNEQFVIKRDSSPNEQLLFGVHSSDYSYIQAVEQSVAYRPLALNPSGGNVGIGTTSPLKPLHVELPTGVNGDLVALARSSGSYRFNLGVSSDSSYYVSNNSNTQLIVANYQGWVTMPYQPAFHAYLSTGTLSSGSIIVYGNAYVNVGSHYNTSNGRFTAPVAGTYLFHWSAIGNAASDVYRYYLYKNGSASFGAGDAQIRHDTTTSEYGDGMSRIQMLTLAANDYIQVYYVADGGNASYVGGDYVNFGGYLIG